jgi:site-specific recombinase XerD
MRRTGGGWSKGQVIGKKRPFTKDQVNMIRMSLSAKGDATGLAMFEVGISTMLRFSDFARLTVGDVVSMGEVVQDFEVGQRKTGSRVKCGLSDRARAALQAHLAGLGDTTPDRPLWLHQGRKLGYKRYRDIVRGWARLAHADPDVYGTHSMRRTMPSHIYRETRDIEAARQLLGHASVASTSSYLDVSRDDAIAIKRRYEI